MSRTRFRMNPHSMVWSCQRVGDCRGHRQKLPPKVLYKKVFFKNGVQASDLNFIKTETLKKVFSCEFFEVFKNIYFEQHLQTAGSVGTARNPTDIPYLPLFSMYCNPLRQK